MVFSSTVFLFLFLPGVLLCYYLPVPAAARRLWRNGFLLAASLLFYAWGEPVFVFAMLFSIAVNHAAALRIEKSPSAKVRKALAAAAIVWNVSLLFVFKYLTFVSTNLAALFGTSGLERAIALPIGISFFTFQIISYILDVYNKKAAAQKNPALTALYISMFPQLIAGPIVRYQSIAQEIENRAECFADVSRGIRRFIIGFAKKMLIANYCGFIADKLFDIEHVPSTASAWLGGVMYTFQIYFDFSAYSDMAIGLALMFGFHFAENFNYPYSAASVTEFWRRWHISLGSWFRDYVYIPLGGNRVSKGRVIGNLFVVWLLTGIWHGAAWTFALWGIYYFLLLTGERLLRPFVMRYAVFKNRVCRHLYTMCAVILGWVLFRSAGIGAFWRYFLSMIGFGANGFVDKTFYEYIKNLIVLLPAGMVFSTPVCRIIGSKLDTRRPVLQAALAFCLPYLFWCV